jgi:hypothetical protein
MTNCICSILMHDAPEYLEEVKLKRKETTASRLRFRHHLY